MSRLTRAQIRQHAATWNGEQLGSHGATSPFLWNTSIDTAANEIARRTNRYTLIQMADVVASQQDYTPSELIYQYTSVQFIDTTGTFHDLQETTNSELDAIYGQGTYSASGWRNQTPGTPAYFSTQGNGSNRLKIFPTPSASSFVYAYVDLAIQGSPYQVTSAQRPFQSTDQYSFLRISAPQSGSFTPGIYQILEVNTGVATLNNPIGVPMVVAGASNANPIVITTLTTHGLSTGDQVAIVNVLGNTAANGTWTIIVVSTNSFSLTGSVGNGSYTSGGTAGTLGTATLSQGGIYVEGYAIPGDSWPNADDYCPLPPLCQEALCWRVAQFRALQDPTPNMTKYAMFKDEFEKQMRLLEAEGINMTAETRAADHPSMPRRRRWY